MEYNVYCDESCHLVSNDSKYMLIGAAYCPKHKVKKVNEYIEHLKENYNISNKIELKWNKVDKKTEKLYLDIINYFFNNIYHNTILSSRIVFNNKKTNPYHELVIYQTRNFKSSSRIPLGSAGEIRTLDLSGMNRLL